MPDGEQPPPTASWKADQGSTVMTISGRWHRNGPAPTLEGEPTDAIATRYDTADLKEFDSTLPAFLLGRIRLGKPSQESDGEKQSPSLEGLPENLRGLMELALAVPEQNEAKGQSAGTSTFRKLGKITLSIWKDLKSITEFIGMAVLSLVRLFSGRARLRWADFWVIVQQAGVEALPIVSLISFLIGLILAFVGNVQLQNFGASIFVADLVGIAMVREMGAVMTGIIMSGRTGAAFAANLGSMKANEEIDALQTFGFNPFDFLVLPRILALVIMMPILTIYANIVGILGGMLVGIMVDIPPVLYWQETLSAITLTTASLGVMKSLVFGCAIAIGGCYQGMKAGNSSAAVGEATTRAVVSSITAVIVIDSAFAAIFTVLGI